MASVLLHCCCPQTPEGKFLQVPSWAEPAQSNGSFLVQGSSKTCRKVVALQILPKERETRMCYRNGMNLPTWMRSENVQGSNPFLQFLKWSVREPDRCSTHPKYNSKLGRWHQVKPPAMMGFLLPLVVIYEKWTCLTSKESVPAMGSAARAKENQLI